MEDRNNEKTKIEALIQYVRTTPTFRQLVPMEAVTGWPVPFKKDGRVYMKIPFYGAQNKGKGSTAIYPPMAAITVEYSSKKIVEYVNIRYSNPLPELKWDEQVGQFPHEAVARLTVKEYKEKKRLLMSLYDEIAQCLTDGSGLEEEKNKQFKTLLNTLVEPSLKPYYKALSQKFFGHYLE